MKMCSRLWWFQDGVEGREARVRFSEESDLIPSLEFAVCIPTWYNPVGSWQPRTRGQRPVGEGGRGHLLGSPIAS